MTLHNSRKQKLKNIESELLSSAFNWDKRTRVWITLCLLNGFSGGWVQVFTFLQITPKRLDVESWNFYTILGIHQN